MSKKILLLVGVAAVVALFAVSSFQAKSAFLFSEDLDDVQQEFLNFLAAYAKYYNSHDEFHERFLIFKDNYKRIMQTDGAGMGFTLAINQFADLTHEEFLKQYTGYRHLYKNKNTEGRVMAPNTGDHPAKYDQRDQGTVTRIKDQGSCGSCWSFSATGSIEGAHFQKSGELVDLSEQQIVDCCRGGSYESDGCNGGLMTEAFDWVSKNGQCLDADYPYTARTGTCKSTCEAKTHVDQTYHVKETVDAMEDAIYAEPVSVAVAVDFYFQFYSSGVFHCTRKQELNHGVVAVAYDEAKDSNGDAFFMIKNSWGNRWGENGYMRMLMKDSVSCCGCLDDADYATTSD